MAHINRRIVGPYCWKRTNKSVEEVIAENPIGKISAISSCPFIYKIVDSRATPQGDGMFEVLFSVEPASPDETAVFLKWDWSPNADRGDQAMWTASDLRQRSWYSGIPVDKKLFCAAHQKLMPAHGGNLYDNAFVCNRCVEQIEMAIAQNTILDPQTWINKHAAISMVMNKIDEIEAHGHGNIKLGTRRFIEIVVLYEFIRNSEYKADAVIEDHYPYKDMVPTAYRGYLREDWTPDEYFNAPTKTIVFTSRNKLVDFLESGGKVPANSKK